MTGPVGSATPDGGARFPVIVLASGSPRRTELLTGLGLPHEIDPSEIDESFVAGETAGARVARLAVEKAQAVRTRHREAWLLAGDTEVVLDGESLGKPRDGRDARRMLGRLAGRSHLVLSSIALLRPGAPADVDVVATRVHLRELDARTVDRYVATGEPLDKAGAYGIQGLGSTLVDRIEGDYTAVVGLPVVALVRLLERAGLRWAFAVGWLPDATAVDPDREHRGDG